MNDELIQFYADKSAGKSRTWVSLELSQERFQEDLEFSIEIDGPTQIRRRPKWSRRLERKPR